MVPQVVSSCTNDTEESGLKWIALLEDFEEKLEVIRCGFVQLEKTKRYSEKMFQRSVKASLNLVNFPSSSYHFGFMQLADDSELVLYEIQIWTAHSKIPDIEEGLIKRFGKFTYIKSKGTIRVWEKEDSYQVILDYGFDVAILRYRTNKHRDVLDESNRALKKERGLGL